MIRYSSIRSRKEVPLLLMSIDFNDGIAVVIFEPAFRFEGHFLVTNISYRFNHIKKAGVARNGSFSIQSYELAPANLIAWL